MSQDPWDMQEEVDRRERIARILQSSELLLWHSMNNQESVPQTRMRLQYQLCGIKEPEPEWEDEYSTDAQEEQDAKRRRNRANKKAAEEKEKEKEKGKGSKKASGGAKS